MIYNEENCSIEISVSELCEYALLSGDIGAHGRTDVYRGASELYKTLQAEAKGFYDPQVELCNTVAYEGIYYSVSGRADGVIRGADGYLCVDEVRQLKNYEFFALIKINSIAKKSSI